MWHVDKTRDEISKQLDVMLMMKKIAFLENCMNFLFEEHELRCLHLNRKLTLEEAAEIRKRFSMRGKLFRYNKRLEEDEGRNEKDSEDQKGPIKATTSMNVMTQNGQKMRGILEESVSHVERISDNSIGKGSEEDSKEIDEELEGIDSDLSSEDDEADQRVYRDVMNSLWELKQEALGGNRRSSKIYDSLDDRLRKLMKDKKMESWIRKARDPNCDPNYDEKIINGEVDMHKYASSAELMDPVVCNVINDFEDN